MRGDRSINGKYPHGCSLDEMAEITTQHAEAGMDSYSGYGVGASLLVRFDLHETFENDFGYNLYAGCNINLSGMEVKIHAEQLALFQSLMDIECFDLREQATLERVMVATTENDLALRCGHCFQVLYGACEFLDSPPEELEYIAVKGQQTMTERGPDGVNWTYDKYNLEELFPESYTSRRREE